ncbi:SPOR domain-containing protein [Marinomonas sp. GJ51-6]|uniref:SPOR domain-containing protein n=1 Tax=Marinomonas sp. GJ51-6 TaxID=2992802 RepID=UPI00293501DA|nr:SPOR domain-containing protein [Marinomonas sp. GJ51-6]WOD07876.1 SPOR domain-containing protein [Marinomonas sp. GJ51-6]
MGIAKKLVLVIAGLSLGACSSTGEKNTFLTYNELQDKVHAHDEQWKSVQPQLAKIDALEAEVEKLKQENMALANTANADALSDEEMIAESTPMLEEPMSAEDVASEPMVMEEQTNTDEASLIASAPLAAPVDTEPKIAPKVVSKIEYGVQLSAYKSRTEAIRSWNVLHKNDPNSFKGLDPRVSQKSIGGTDMYQLKVGAFLSKSFAADFCQMLKEKGQDCFVTQYDGEDFSIN